MNKFSYNHKLMRNNKSKVVEKIAATLILNRKKKVTVKNRKKNTNTNERKCMKNMENNKLTIALQINGREPNVEQSVENDTIQTGSQEDNKCETIKLKGKINGINDDKIIKEIPLQNKIYENSLESEMKNLDIVEELLNKNSSTIASHEVEISPNMENGNLECSSSNCVCFCNGEGGAHHVLSIVENGFFSNHNKESDDDGERDGEDDDGDGDDTADDMDESDLPNYSRSCVYEERIIDFENFRIIEQVIDNNCEGKHTAANNVKCRNAKECKRNQNEQLANVTETESKQVGEEANDHLELPSSSQNIQASTPIYVNPALNFSCSELVAFIGESYQVIDNAQAFYNNDKTSKSKKCTQFKTKSESCSVGNSPFKRSKRSGFGSGSASTSNRSVDDNNNTARVTGITAAERLMQSLNCDVSRELTQTKRVEKRETKAKSKPTVSVKTSTPTKTLLKALKSKLTPLAPPFQPAAIKSKETKPASGASSSSTLVNYEQTTIYYQQNHQQQQQQQILANNMLHYLCLNTANQQHILQQQQVSPSQQQQQQLFLAQQHHHLQPQHQHILQTLNPTHPQHHHQQHCAQNILAMSAASLAGQGMPHIHLPAAATASATNNNGNLSSTATAAAAVINVAATNPASHHHQHLLPIHLISAVGSTGGSGGGVNTWPLLEPNNSASNNATATVTTTPIYMDFNGELRSICPAHGPPPTAVTITTPLAPITNQASTASTSNPNNIMQQQNSVCLNPSQYPLTVTAQYHAVTQQHQQNQAQLHHHLQQQHHHHSHHLTQQQQQLHKSSLANSQNSPLRIKSTQASNSSSSSSSTSAAATTSSSTAAVATTSAAPRVVLQLDAGVSLPLQIAGKRKIFRGPTTVQMVSQNRPPPPPMPVPVQVPQGQVMQPYVNESGTLTHVVLSPQHYQQLHAGQGHMHPPFLTTNGTSHFYTPIPGGFPPGAGGQGPGPYQVGPHGHMPPPPQAGTPQPQQQQSSSVGNSSQQQQQHSPASHSANHSPSPPSNNYHKDERTQRQHTKLLRKLDKQRSAVSSPAHSPSPRRQEPQINGHNTNNNGSLRSQQQHNNNNNHHQRKQQQQTHQQQHQPQQQRNGNVSNYNNRQGASSVASSEEGDDNLSLGVNGADGDEEEDYQASIVEQLSTIQKPEVTDITSRSAKIVWEAPQCISESALQLINMRELRYNVLLSDRAKECKYKSLYKGSSYDCIVQDLKPGQEYVVRLQVHYEHLHGTASEPTEFTTPACEPDRPAAPRMVMCTKNSLHLRWNNPLCNGSSIQHYLLEYDEGKTGARVVNEAACKFVEAVKTKGRQYIMTKLQPSTIYNFRLAAVNEVGPSAYSPVCTFSTQGNPPSAPKPPTLQAFNSSSLRLVWERRQSDGATCIYVLQMLDRGSGHGYLNMYNGQDCSYECCQLRRATLYYFRLRAENEAGASAWSNEVAYKTAPERPGRPGKPYAKGKIHGTHFRVRWEPPTDNGGAEIQRYYLEINAGGQKFDRIYTGVDCEASCDRLQPGTTYQLRASCEGPGGLSPYSEVSHITSEAVVPAAPPSPYYDNPPGPYAAVLRLDKPEYNGGAPILEFELQLRKCSEQETPRSVYRGKDAYCVIKDLQPGNQYEVQVRAINRIGAGAWSPWFKFSSAAAAPNCPESLKVIIKSATQLHVSWQEPANKGGAPIAEYRLESATASNVSNDSESSTPQPPPSSAFHTCYQGLQTSADIRNLMPFTYYYFRVNACNMAGVSKWSPLVNCQTPAAVPSAPQIKDLEFTSNDATLRWSSPECNGSEITNYTIEYAERTIMTSDNACEYTVTNLQPETSYKFRVQAINAIGSGPYSLYAKLTTLPSPPTPPKLECSGVGHNFIKLKWGDGKNLDFTKFYVEMFVQRAKEFQVVYSGTNCMCKVNKLQERTAYTFRICAGNDRAGVGEYSEEFVFSTSACLPNSIKAPRIAQNLPSAASSASTSSANANSGSSPSSSSSGGGVIPSGLLPETPSFLTGLGNLMLGVPLTLEWQHSKNSFSDRVEYMLQYAIGKDGEFKKIYRGSETKFTIENLEPGGLYQFRVCPIRVTNNGEDLLGAYTPPFRHQVPLIPSLDDIDGNLLGNAAAQMFAGLNAASGSANHATGSCHGHSHHHTHHSHMGGHSHHHNPLHSHHNSRHSGHHNNNNNGGGSNDSNSTTNLHHRSVSASAGSSSSSSNSSSSKNQNSNANNTPSNNTLLIGSNAIGFIPIGSMASELAASFAGCDDPNHHHHHHHHGFPDVANQLNATASSTSGSSNSSNNPQSAASLLAASANQLFANNPILLQAATAAISHHQHVLGHHHGGGAHNQNAGALRRFVTKLSSVYSNRKRFSDQEKAVIFMVSFLFFTFLFATLVKMFMR